MPVVIQVLKLLKKTFPSNRGRRRGSCTGKREGEGGRENSFGTAKVSIATRHPSNSPQVKKWDKEGRGISTKGSE